MGVLCHREVERSVAMHSHRKKLVTACQEQGLTLNYTPVITQLWRIFVSNTTLVLKSFNALRRAGADTLRDLLAAMPIVIFAKALRDALQGAPRAHTSMLSPAGIDRASELSR